MVFRAINILGYPTNRASSGGFSDQTPHAYERFLHSHFAGKYGINKNFIMVPVENSDSPRKNGIQNYDSVYTSVRNLCLAQAKILWQGNVPLTIGGDHSQGFSTVKSALLVAVLKNLISEDSILLSEQKNLLRDMADKGDFIEAAEMLDNIADKNTKLLSEINKTTDNIHVIWVDAHGDFNTKDTSATGNFHGMSLAAACGLDTGGIENIFGKYIKANTKNVHIMCTRDLDEDEEDKMRILGVDFERFIMNNSEKGKIRAKGQPRSEKARDMNIVFKELVAEIKKLGKKIILSTDIDHLSVPETGTPLGSEENIRKNRYNQSPAGPKPSDTYFAYEKIAKDESFIAFDITEIALGYVSEKTGKFVVGVKALKAGINILASIVGGKEARGEVIKAIKKEGNLRKRIATFTDSLIS